MTKCASCGLEVPPESKFCHSCGKPVSAAPALQTDIRDSVINRSDLSKQTVNINLPAQERSAGTYHMCKVCSNVISGDNRALICDECESIFCEACEIQFRRGIARRPGEAVLCKRCYKASLQGAPQPMASPAQAVGQGPYTAYDFAQPNAPQSSTGKAASGPSAQGAIPANLILLRPISKRELESSQMNTRPLGSASSLRV